MLSRIVAVAYKCRLRLVVFMRLFTTGGPRRGRFLSEHALGATAHCKAARVLIAFSGDGTMFSAYDAGAPSEGTHAAHA